MAVYTHVSAEALSEFLTRYDVGELVSAKGIAEGVENTNYLVDTTGGRFILTLYERRVAADDLPYFLALLDHLAAAGLPVPPAIKDRTGVAVQTLAERPACLIKFLPGVSLSEPNPAQARAAGEALGRMHAAVADFVPTRANTMGASTWPVLYERCGSSLDQIAPGLSADLGFAIGDVLATWPEGKLARCAIHADLFPDNVLMRGDAVGGLIDFYFACDDYRLYDLAVMHAAWSFDATGERQDHSVGAALIAGYERVFPFGDDDHRHFSGLASGACIRFTLSRAWDWLNTPADALVTRKDPLAFWRRLRAYDPDLAGPAADVTMTDLPAVEIATDGACKGNPGPGGWGAVLRMGTTEKDLSGGERLTTNNRMELTAVIQALNALTKPCEVQLSTDSRYVMDGLTKWVKGWQRNGWRTADKKPVKNVELWQALIEATARHRIRWTWVKGHAGHPDNERADRLASDAAVLAARS